MDYWKILNLSEDSTLEKIKKAYRELVKKYHPDHNPSPDANRRFQEIQEAYDYLKEHPGSGKNTETAEDDLDDKEDFEEEKNSSFNYHARNFHERYNSQYYSKNAYGSRTSTASSTNKKYSSSTARKNSSGNTYSSKKSSTSSSRSSYTAYSDYKPYYQKPDSSYIKQKEGHSVAEKIIFVILGIIGLICLWPVFMFILIALIVL